MDFLNELERILKKKDKRIDPDRPRLIAEVVKNREAFVSANGALATWTPVDSTGRSPKDTMIVRRPEIVNLIDWDSPNNIPIDPGTFDMILADALEIARGKEKFYITDRVVGAESGYALPVRTVTDRAVTALFSMTMFREKPPDLKKSIYAGRPFSVVAFPASRLDKKKYAGRLRQLPDGSTSDMVVLMDFESRLGLIIGSLYMGTLKKLIFTAMNFILPQDGILPLHTSANEGPAGDIALFLGLSGTGKTTLSADPERSLLGDDEHGWDDNGIANFENGCYAKLINLNPVKEPQIYEAVMHRDDYRQHGAIVENAMMYPDGRFDFYDGRFTENSRGSFPLTFLPKIKPSSKGGHPKFIVFLTADANGVLPPVARLSQEQAMLWFLMGYTSKLAGTETGVVEPSSTFSRFFGQPFMPCNPDVYATMLGQKTARHGSNVFLINTGWSGGPYRVGKRIDIPVTRAIISALLNGQLDNVPYREDTLFHIQVPLRCPGVPEEILDPRHTWKDKDAFDQRAKKLAAEFSATFDRAYGKKNIPEAIRSQCPGK